MVVGSDEHTVDILADEVVVGPILVGTVVPKETLQGRHALAEVRDLPTEGADVLLLPDNALLALLPVGEDASDAGGGGVLAEGPQLGESAVDHGSDHGGSILGGFSVGDGTDFGKDLLQGPGGKFGETALEGDHVLANGDNRTIVRGKHVGAAVQLSSDEGGEARVGIGVGDEQLQALEPLELRQCLGGPPPPPPPPPQKKKNIT